MALPLLNYSPSSQNQRVAGYDVGGDEKPRVFSTDDLLDSTSMDALIDAAYRQIFFHAFKWDREPFLESQLRNGQITVRDFIRGLLLSNTFYSSFYEKNNNYRFVEHCVERVLGRQVYNEREKIAWSIVVAAKGIQGVVAEQCATAPLRRVLSLDPGLPPDDLADSGASLCTPRQEANRGQSPAVLRYGSEDSAHVDGPGSRDNGRHQHCDQGALPAGCVLTQICLIHWELVNKGERRRSPFF